MKKLTIAELMSVCAFCEVANCTSAEEPTQNVDTTVVSEHDNSDISGGTTMNTPGIMQGNETNTTASQVTGNNILQNKSQMDKKKKNSWWDTILKLFKVSEERRTSEQAYNDMMKSQNVVIDFSNVIDFAQNGNTKMLEYYQKIISTKAFGTQSPNIYINLSNTNVSSDLIAKWSIQFKKDKKIVIWNLSENKNLDDKVIDALDFSSIYSLNLSGTSVTDAGIAKIVATLETNGIGNLVCIHLSNSKVTEAGIMSLKTTMQKANDLWKSQNPDKERKLQGMDNSGVVFEKMPELPANVTTGNQQQSIPQKENTPISVAPDFVATDDTAKQQQTTETLLPESTDSINTTLNTPATNEEKDLSDVTMLAKSPDETESIEMEAKEALNNANEIINATSENNVVASSN